MILSVCILSPHNHPVRQLRQRNSDRPKSTQLALPMSGNSNPIPSSFPGILYQLHSTYVQGDLMVLCIQISSRGVQMWMHQCVSAFAFNLCMHGRLHCMQMFLAKLGQMCLRTYHQSKRDISRKQVLRAALLCRQLVAAPALRLALFPIAEKKTSVPPLRNTTGRYGEVEGKGNNFLQDISAHRLCGMP